MDHRSPERRASARTGARRLRARVVARAPLAPTLARTFVRLLGRAAVGAAIGIAVAAAALALDAAIGWSLPFAHERVQDVLITLTGAALTIAVFALWMRSVVVGLVAGVFHARTLSTFLDDGFQRAITGWMVGAFSVLVTVAIASPGIEHGGVPPIATLLSLTTIVGALLGILLAVRHATQRLDTSDVVHQLADRAFRILEETVALADDPAPESAHEAVRAIDTDQLGWVRRIDRRQLVRELPEGAHAELLVTPGTFVAPGDTVLTIDTQVDEATADALRASIEIGRVRDPHSDLAYSIEELTDVAQNAAGAGSDVVTAREALHYIEALLTRLLERGLPTGHVREGARRLTAVAQPTVADHLARAAERLHTSLPGDPVTARMTERMLEGLATRADELGQTATVEALRSVGVGRSDARSHPRALADDEHRAT